MNHRYVAFLRAVNVGGRYIKMAVLRQALIDAGYLDVQTYIQSGNVHVATPERDPEQVAQALAGVLSAAAGFAIPAIVRTPDELRLVAEAIQSMPIPDGLPGDPATVRRYVTFFDRPCSDVAQVTFANWEAAGERARAHEHELYMWLTIGLHEVRLTGQRIERISGATYTTRDAKVVIALADKWGPVD